MIPIPTLDVAESWLENAQVISAENGITTGWIDHSRYVGEIAFYIATAAGMNANFAMILGLIHDIGRQSKLGKLGLKTHGFEGYKILCNMGYPELARFCLTHCYIENEPFDDEIDFIGLDNSEIEIFKSKVYEKPYTDYDRLLMLADGLAVKEGYVTLEQRFVDLIFRYGNFSPSAMQSILKLKQYFDEKIGDSIYNVIPNFISKTLKFKYTSLEEIK